MTLDAPYDVIAYFDSEELELVLVASDDGEWMAAASEQRRALLNPTVLVVMYTRGIRKIAVRHHNRVVEFDLEDIVRRGEPLEGIERQAES